MITPIFFEKGATPRQLITALMNMCTDHPELMDRPVTIFRSPYEARNNEYFGIGTIETVGNGEEEQIMFES